MSNRFHGARRGLQFAAVLMAAGIPFFVCDRAAVAQTSGSQPPDAEERSRVTAAAEAGWERLGADSYASTSLKFGVRLPVPELLCDDSATEGNCGTEFRAGVQAPLRFRVIDRAPQDEQVLRRADWDETSDFLRVVRYVQYGSADTSVSARLGELGAMTLGHGTIVNDYFNVVTPDQYRAGITARVDAPAGGANALLDDVVQPSLVGTRLHVRPGELVAPQSWWSRITVGTTFVADLEAPTALRRTGDERPVIGPGRLPAVESRRPTGVVGVDLSLHVLEREWLTLVPYSDWNAHLGLGKGLHAGVQTHSRVADSVELTSRFEFRSLGSRYLPEYFGPLYEIDRYQFFGWGVLLPAPKLRIAAEPRAAPVLGGYGELTARLYDRVALSAAYADHEGPENSNLRFSLQTDPVDRLRIGAFYFKQNFGDFEDLIRREGTFLVTESRVRILGPLYAKGGYGLLWQLRDDGVYRPIHRWHAGLGVSVGL